MTNEEYRKYIREFIKDIHDNDVLAYIFTVVSMYYCDTSF